MLQLMTPDPLNQANPLKRVRVPDLGSAFQERRAGAAGEDGARDIARGRDSAGFDGREGAARSRSGGVNGQVLAEREGRP